jgi:hypothetical protein
MFMVPGLAPVIRFCGDNLRAAIRGNIKRSFVSELEIDRDPREQDSAPERTFRLRGQLTGETTRVLVDAIELVASHGARSILIDAQGIDTFSADWILTGLILLRGSHIRNEPNVVAYPYPWPSITVLPNNPNPSIRLKLKEIARFLGGSGGAGVTARQPDPDVPRAGAAEGEIPRDES